MAAEQQPKLLKDSQPDTLATLELELNNFRVDQSPKKAIGQLQAASRVEGSYDIPSVTLPRPFNSSRKSRAQPNTSRELQIPSFQPQDFKIPPDLRSSWSWQVQNRRAEAFVGPPFPQHMYPPYAQPYNTFMPMGLTVPTFLSDERPNSELTQCALLQEFRHGSRARRFELRDIYGHVVEFSSDQQGSRFIQARLETASTEEKYKIFMEIQDNALALMTDVFGNYVIQKFFEHGDQTHKRLLCRAMRGHVLSLTLQMYGCRVVQKALEHVLVDQQAAIVRELEGNVLKCVRDQNGNHVIQKAIERCQPQLLASIINSFRGHAQQLSNHTYGCRVIQRLLERTEGQRTHIMDELTTSIPQMIEDQFGNYVVQHLVQYDPNHGRVMVMHIVLAQLEQLSKAKFASNVVEKCLVEGDERFRINVLARLLGNLRLLASLVQDRVGNYVIQKLIETLNEDGFHTFVHHLQPVMMQTRRLGGYEKPIASIGKKITARLSRQSYSNVLFS
ncbi:ARM repeat-containing protein [Piedraia hortae CBS 480.64]|uniref:ARM repeat-containing protein n=1 Tax=Piedraia hortae CBS 480.64 TaxID=1314780 RepID=A0A6A7C2M6_9PEZI|nr:ARM repeat-containing protein [Piedraia hortae CBS 480.64]